MTSEVRLKADTTHRTIVALGDSTTAGTPGFASPIEAPPEGRGNVESQYAYWLMRAHPDWQVLNRGVNGERADQIRARVQRDVLDAHAEAVIVIAGVNDIYQGRSAESVQQALEAIYDAARAAGITVVAGTIVPYNTATPDANERMRRVNAWIRQYASAPPGRAGQIGLPGVRFCDTRAAVAAPGDPDRLVSSPDDLHPSPDGYRLMAAALDPILENALARAHL